MECEKCNYMDKTCTIESLYGIDQLKSCPFLNEPVLNEYGWLMNPPFTEKYQLSSGHVFLIPEKIDSKWIVHWSLFKDGAGSCGRSEIDLFILAYKKAIKDLLSTYRLTDIDREEIQYISDNKFDNRRSFLPRENKIEEIPEKIEYISPFSDMEFGEIGDQLELF